MKNTPEFKTKFPGDELIPHPRQIITHAVIINAPPEKIWPWIIQLGSGRAGWYSYDKIDNGGKPSAWKLISELQHIEIGDIMPAIPNTKDSFLVQEVDQFKTLILVVPVLSAFDEPDVFIRMKSPLRVSWTLHLVPRSDKTTKLISHGRISQNWLTYKKSESTGKMLIERIYRLISKVPWPLMLPFALIGHYIMVSHMLRGIKKRAEGH